VAYQEESSTRHGNIRSRRRYQGCNVISMDVSCKSARTAALQYDVTGTLQASCQDGIDSSIQDVPAGDDK
jgi:uncharacterized protein GlcG (DUF336 family)